MRSCHIAICEEESFLTASLEREFSDKPEITFRWYPYRDDFFTNLENHDCDFAILECRKLSQEHLLRISRLPDRLKILALIPAEDFEFECLLREVGINSVLPETVDFERILQFFDHLFQLSERQPAGYQ